MTGSCARRDHRLQLRRLGCDKEETMSDFPAVADRVEIEALRGEFTDAAMMRDGDRQAMHPGTIQLDGDTASGRMRSQINLIRAAADPRLGRSPGEQI
jgi:hypothetical protein